MYPAPKLIALGLCLPLLAGCVGSDFEFDLRPDRISTRVTGETAPRPEPDANGLITYDSYQMVVARRGDTVADVARRIGMEPEELARFNGRNAGDPLRADEILALPRPVTPGAGSETDIAAIASGAIDAAEARQDSTTPAPAAAPPGQEPVRHRVGRGETAYSIARLYGVSVRSLAEWNGLGPELSVREGQYLIIPIIIEEATATPGTGPGMTVAPLPPSADEPLPEPVEPAPAPPQGTEAAAPAAAPAPSEPAAVDTSARFAYPVEGGIIRPYGNGNEGIDIAAATGTAVRAAADGEVAAITQDTDQIPILVLRHPDGLLTIYANIRNIAVTRGDRVSRGQTLAEVGPGDPPSLHFEVRRGFEAVDPTRYLP